MKKRKKSLLIKFGFIFLIFVVVTILVSGVATYFNQTRIYQEQEEKKLKNIGDYLGYVLSAEGTDFPDYQKYMLAHYKDVDVPADFTEKDARENRKAFEAMFAAQYPGKVLGQDIEVEGLSPELQELYAVYNHEHYLLLFENASDRFDIAYAYYIVPTGENLEVYYLLDGVRETRENENNLNLADVVEEVMSRHAKLWNAWYTGRAPTGYDTFKNDYGKTYAWYTPLYVNGKKLGLIGTEVEIADYNRAIASNTFRQLASIAAILIIASLVTLWIVDHFYISKIRLLSDAVAAYAKDKDANVAKTIEHVEKDELTALSNQTAAMILELDNHMKNLLETREKLSDTRLRAELESELARKDALTGVRNRIAYEEEERRLASQIEEGQTHFGFVVVDMNFLKQINDTYGHEKGNLAIQNCCALVCRVFTHSPVFRIGGDEFTVILEHEDYDNRKMLVEEFKRLAGQTDGKSGEPWETISAAVGYAVYDPAWDKDVESVFSRADKAMYQCKREMKGE